MWCRFRFWVREWFEMRVLWQRQLHPSCLSYTLDSKSQPDLFPPQYTPPPPALPSHQTPHACQQWRLLCGAESGHSELYREYSKQEQRRGGHAGRRRGEWSDWNDVFEVNDSHGWLFCSVVIICTLNHIFPFMYLQTIMRFTLNLTRLSKQDDEDDHDLDDLQIISRVNSNGSPLNVSPPGE